MVLKRKILTLRAQQFLLQRRAGVAQETICGFNQVYLARRKLEHLREERDRQDLQRNDSYLDEITHYHQRFAEIPDSMKFARNSPKRSRLGLPDPIRSILLEHSNMHMGWLSVNDLLITRYALDISVSQATAVVKLRLKLISQGLGIHREIEREKIALNKALDELTVSRRG